MLDFKELFTLVIINVFSEDNCERGQKCWEDLSVSASTGTEVCGGIHSY